MFLFGGRNVPKKNTGVFATADEIAELLELRKAVDGKPLIFVDGDLGRSSWLRLVQRCHAIALSHGLPEIPGYYGMEASAEFVWLEDPWITD